MDEAVIDQEFIAKTIKKVFTNSMSQGPWPVLFRLDEAGIGQESLEETMYQESLYFWFERAPAHRMFSRIQWHRVVQQSIAVKQAAIKK